MNGTRRLVWIVTLAAFLSLTCGCAGTSLRTVEDEMARGGTGIRKDRGQGVRGYLLADETMVEYKGYVRLTEQDSLMFWSKGYSEEVQFRGQKEEIKIPGPVYASSAVQALDVWESHSGRSASLLVAGFLGLSIFIWAMMGGDIWE